MIVYHRNVSGFRRDVATGDIDRIVLAALRRALGTGVGEAERRAWHQSLSHMHIALDDPIIRELIASP